MKRKKLKAKVKRINRRKKKKGKRLKKPRKLDSKKDSRIENENLNKGFDYWYTSAQNIVETLGNFRNKFGIHPKKLYVSVDKNDISISLKMSTVDRAIKIYEKMVAKNYEEPGLMYRKNKDSIEFLGKTKKYNTNRGKRKRGKFEEDEKKSNKERRTLCGYEYKDIEQYLKRKIFLSTMNFFLFKDKHYPKLGSEAIKKEKRRDLRNKTEEIDLYFSQLFGCIKDFEKKYPGLLISEKKILGSVVDMCKKSEDEKVKKWSDQVIYNLNPTTLKEAKFPFLIIQNQFLENKMKILKKLMNDNNVLLKRSGLYIFK